MLTWFVFIQFFIFSIEGFGGDQCGLLFQSQSLPFHSFDIPITEKEEHDLSILKQIHEAPSPSVLTPQWHYNRIESTKFLLSGLESFGFEKMDTYRLRALADIITDGALALVPIRILLEDGLYYWKAQDAKEAFRFSTMEQRFHNHSKYKTELKKIYARIDKYRFTNYVSGKVKIKRIEYFLSVDKKLEYLDADKKQSLITNLLLPENLNLSSESIIDRYHLHP